MISALETLYNLYITDVLYLIAAVLVVAGIIGFVYEEIFYRIDLKKWVKRGSTFGPWIPIYGFGGILLALLVYSFRAHWIVVLLLSCLVTGLLEYLAGLLIFRITGRRLWNYYTEIWNWGNIGGFVCARSVILFGLGGLALVYWVIPLAERIFSAPHGTAWKNVMLVLCVAFIADIIAAHFLKEPHRISDEDEAAEKQAGSPPDPDTDSE